MKEIITLSHCRSLGYCLHGVRRFCTRYDLDFKQFVKEGTPVSEVEHIDDHMLRMIIERVRNG